MALTKIGTDGVKDDAVTTDKLANAINTERTANTAKVSTTINNNADNRVITGSGTANTLNGEANLTFSSSLLVSDGNGSVNVGGNYALLKRTSGTTNYIAAPNADAVLDISADETIRFGTVNTGDFNSTERMRITSSGQLLIGTTSTSGISAGSDDIVIGSIGDSTVRGLTFATTDYAAIRWADAGDNAMGRIEYNNSVDIMTFHTSNAERLRIDSSGNVGIGKTPYRKLDIDTSHYVVTSSGQATTGIHLDGAAGNAGEYGGGISFGCGNAGSSAIAARQGGSDPDVVGLAFFTHGSATGTDDAVERMRLEAGGNLVWTGGSTQYVTFNNAGDVVTIQTAGTSAANHGMVYFKDGAGTYCGQITSHGTNHTTSYNTNSDYRLKQNEASISDGITRLKQLKPYRFEWKSSGNKVDGFFAHEAQAVVPESVIGTKDEVDSDNNPIYQGIDQSKLVPLLTAALKEAIAKIEVLETKVAALEAA